MENEVYAFLKIVMIGCKCSCGMELGPDHIFSAGLVRGRAHCHRDFEAFDVVGLQFEAVLRPRYVNGDDHHLFEKPAELCQLLVGKHSDPGDLVIEPFGATGAVSLAAATMGRRWVYCETNQQNFEIGTARLMNATSVTPRAVG